VHNIIKDISIIAEARPAESWFVVFLSYNYLLLFDLSFSHARTITAQPRTPHAILFLIKTRGQNKNKIKSHLEMYSDVHIIIIIAVRIANTGWFNKPSFFIL